MKSMYALEVVITRFFFLILHGIFMLYEIHILHALYIIAYIDLYAFQYCSQSVAYSRRSFAIKIEITLHIVKIVNFQ